VNVPGPGEPAPSIFDVAMKWLTGISLGSSFLVGVWLGVVANPRKEFDGCEESARFVIGWFVILLIAFSVATGMRIAGRVVTTWFIAGVLLGGPVLMLGSWLGWQFNPLKETDGWGDATCPPYAMSRELTLVPREFEFDGSVQASDAAGCASIDGVRFCAYSDGREVRLFAANDGPDEVLMYWADIIYRDEVGARHKMITFPDSLVDPQLRATSSTRWQSLVPEEKRAIVVTSGMRHQAIAPFVPFQEAADECNRRERVHALVNEDVRVSLDLPYARNGERAMAGIHLGFERIGAFLYQVRQSSAEEAIEREVR
jgi:hypothetical protein